MTGKTPSRAFYVELFQTGVGSDITIHYGESHTLGLHSWVMDKESTWFKERCVAQADISDEGIAASTLRLFGHNLLKPCSEHKDHKAADDTCAPYSYFKSMLEFCYTGQYPDYANLERVNGKGRCMSHVYVYLLGKHYGVDDILPHAAEGFKKEVKALRNEHREFVIHYLNLIYELPGLLKDDLLRQEARVQAEFIANSTSAPIHLSLLEKNTRTEILRLMPKVGEDLFVHGYEPQSLGQAAAMNNNNCVRCLSALSGPSDSGARLCESCDRVPLTVHQILAPNVFVSGVTITLWPCLSCGEVWQSEGHKTKNVQLEECPTCVPLLRRSKRGIMKVIVWKCGGCGKVWRNYSAQHNEMEAIDGCICCAT